MDTVTIRGASSLSVAPSQYGIDLVADGTAYEVDAAEWSHTPDGIDIDGLWRPNIAPFFQAGVDEPGAWAAISDCYSDLGDGWAQYDEAIASGAAYRYASPAASSAIEAGRPYTLLVEIKDAASTGGYGALRFMAASATIQLGNGVNFATLQDGLWRIPLTAYADLSASERLVNLRYHQQARCSTQFKIRMGLFEGIYNGPWKPFVS